MFKYLLPLALCTQPVFAETIQTHVNATFNELVHITLHARAANTDKPPVLIFDATLPKTEKNGGIAKGLEAQPLSPEALQTEGPIQILYNDFNARKLVPCGEGVAQERGGEKLIKIEIQMKYSPEGISCLALGEYVEKDSDEEGPSSQVAHLNLPS